MSDNLKERAVQGFTWKMGEKIGAQVIQFVLQIILARLLLPEEYGLVGLLTIFITISDVFILQSFTAALIQKKDADEADFSSVYVINVLVSVFIYLILFFSAPLVAGFYQEIKLKSLMRVLSLNVIIGSFCSVQNAILSRNLDFKKSFARNLANVLAQGIVGIGAAMAGFGPWALVFSKLAGTFVGTLVLCFTVRWNFVFRFSLSRLTSLFSFGSKVLANNLINTIFNNLNSLVIGKFYSSSDLGQYQKGQQIPQTLMTAIDGGFSEVLFPMLSSIQDDLERIKDSLRKSMKISMYLVFPVMLGLFAIAEPLTMVLLTEKWLPCVPYLRLQCILCLFWPLSARTHALNAIGRSDVTLKISFVTRGLSLISIFVCLPYGIQAIMMGMIVVSCISVLISTYYVNKMIHYSLIEFMNDILPSLVMSVFMVAMVMLLDSVLYNVFLKLFFEILAGIVTYVIISVIVKAESFLILKKYIKTLLGKKKI